MKVCFAGAGSIGKRHIRNLKTLSEEMGFPLELHLLRGTPRPLDEDIQAIVDRVCYSDEELDSQYDAVFITNPTYLHYQTMVLLQNRADTFFVEKPVFDNLEQNADIFDDGKQYYVACPLRYTKVLLEAQKLLSDKKVLSVRAISSSYLPDWRPGTDYRKTYSAHKDQGGGVCIDLIHEWDYLSALFGMPEEVQMLCGTYSELELDSEDLAVYIGRYRDKLVELHLDYMGRYTRRNFEAITPDEVFQFDITNSCIYRNGECILQFHEQPNDKYLEELRFFIRLLQRQTDNTNDIRHALRVMRVAYGKIG